MFVRQLNASDWQTYKDVRLEALARHGDVFGISLEKETLRDDGSWKAMLSNGTQAFFGLSDGTQIVGITGVITDTYVENSRTAILIASYIREAYRKRGLSALLYKARIDWARQSGQFDRIIVGHREGNEYSRRANQKFGFILYGEEEQTWGDGSTGKIYRYELRLT
jgi:RimJ/RimL family protein N-acetyltransferase